MESALLAVYLFIIAVTIPHHEPWSDEAQAWIIARDNSIWEIFRFRLHYEGAPILWHLILHLFQRLGGHYGGIDWLGAAFATAGIVVFLRYSPFPLLIRVLLPFTFFLQYQYAVIGRGYTLFPLLAFTLCSLFRSRRNPFWFALAAGLMANLTLQGAVYSFFIMGLYIHQRSKTEAYLPGNRSGWLPFWRPAVFYLVFLAVAGFVAVPAPDCGIAHGPPVTSGFLHNMTMHFPGPLPEVEKPPTLPLPEEEGLSAPPRIPDLAPDPPRPQPSFLSSPGKWAVWYVNRDQFDGYGHIQPRPFTQPALEFVLGEVTLATAEISSFKLLSCVFLTCLLAWLQGRRSLHLLLPWVANVIVGQILWIADHHTGMLLIALLTSVWLSADAPSGRKTTQRLNGVFVLLLALVCTEQIAWTAVSIHNEWNKPYDPGPQTARFLSQHPQARVAAFDFFAVGVQPYFSQNRFFNWRKAYWVWNSGENPDGDHFTTLEQHPDLVVFSEDLIARGFTRDDWAPFFPLTAESEAHNLSRNAIIVDLEFHGYRETHRFCGFRFMRFSESYKTCHLIFEPGD